MYIIIFIIKLSNLVVILASTYFVSTCIYYVLLSLTFNILLRISVSLSHFFEFILMFFFHFSPFPLLPFNQYLSILTSISIQLLTFHNSFRASSHRVFFLLISYLHLCSFPFCSNQISFLSLFPIALNSSASTTAMKNCSSFLFNWC